jgi:hypothetical protein
VLYWLLVSGGFRFAAGLRGGCREMPFDQHFELLREGPLFADGRLADFGQQSGGHDTAEKELAQGKCCTIVRLDNDLLDMNSPKKKSSRHGKLAETTGQTSITMNKELLDRAKKAAKAEGRSLSNWLEQLVKKSMLLFIFSLAGWHALRSPAPGKASSWTPAALIASAKAGWHKLAPAPAPAPAPKPTKP